MRRTSLSEAKAHLSELVDQAEHHNKRFVIVRHGKPAAALVPVSDAQVPEARRPVLSADQIEALFAPFGTASPEASAVADLLVSRR